jgi:hypothetical protein
MSNSEDFNFCNFNSLGRVDINLINIKKYETKYN